MKKYIVLQSKRLLRYVPGAIAVTAALVVGLILAFSAIMTYTVEGEHNQKVSLAIVGAGDDPVVEMTMAALTAVDSSQYSLNVQLMTAEAATEALHARRIGAYVEVPDGFVDKAMNGRITTLHFVTKAGATGLVTVFRDEVTVMISDMVVASQKGVYGLNRVLKSVGGYTVDEREEAMNALNLALISCILTRDHVIDMDVLGISDGLAMGDYLMCGLTILLIMLTVLPFAPVHVRSDDALSRMLASKGRSAGMQAVCDLLCWFACLTLIVLLVFATAMIVLPMVSDTTMALLSVSGMLHLLPVLLMVSSLSYMLYALSTDLVSGVLLPFFVTVALCFVSGCIYPVFFFPESIQTAAQYLPTGSAETFLSGCITEQFEGTALLLTLGYGMLFAVIGVWLRVCRVKRGRV